MILKVKKFQNLGRNQTMSAFMYIYINIHSNMNYCRVLYESAGILG